MAKQEEGMRNHAGRLRSDHQTMFLDESKTVQSDAHLADIQEILKLYGVVGMAASLAATEAQFADVSEFTDFADVMRHVRVAEAEFMKLPSKVREEFDHDVSKWLDAAHAEEAREEDPVVPEAAASAAAAVVDAKASGEAEGDLEVSSE